MTNAEKADLLDRAQASENDGRGIRCVQAMVTYLRQNDLESAQTVRQVEGDKTRMYPKVESLLTELFGCRLHLKKSCDHWLCQTFKK
jgi:hypothetical protein